MKQRIRYRGKGKKMDVVYLNEKFVAASGVGKAKDYSKKRRR